jgi:uncharacterized membrane protein
MDKSRLEHEFFRISILLKGIYSFLEFIAGAVLLFITSNKIYFIIHEVFKNELLEDAQDFIANSLLNLVGSMPSAIKQFIAVYLIIHGIIKLILIIALWKEKRAAYPVAIIVFSFFIIYQIYKYILHPSLVLLVLTDLDMLIIILTWLEWRKLKKKR